MSALSILALGHLTFEQIASLQPAFDPIELIDSTLPGDVSLADRAAEINRAIAAAGHSWVLIVREREMVDALLADEVRRAIGEPAQAWGFRIRTQPIYQGRPLLLSRDAGEIRLVHQRHGRLDLRAGEMKVEGPVIRLQHPLRLETFASAAQHEEYLRSRGVPHSWLRRILLFARDALMTGAWHRSVSTLRYLWVEDGYDMGGERREE